VVEKDLAESIAAVLRKGMEQQDSRRSKGGDDQHPLAGVSETAIIANRVFGLLNMVLASCCLVAKKNILIYIGKF
jgi:hypothetical protein